MTQDDKIIELVKTNTSKADICRQMGWSCNGTYCKKIQSVIDRFQLDTSHFRPNKAYLTIKYVEITKVCPVCLTDFITTNGPKSKVTCSKKCSNTYFRSGQNNGNWKPPEQRTKHNSEAYRKLFALNDLVCKRCGYNEFSCSVQIHHIDENRQNHDKTNLIPLCANCHMSYHAGKWNLDSLGCRP